MKKLVLTTLAVSGLSLAAFAQGTISWSGVGPSLVAQTNGTVYSSFAAGSGTPTGTQGNTLGSTAANNAALTYAGYYYELLVNSSAVAAPTTVAGLSGWLDTGLSATNAASSNGRLSQVNPSTQAVAANMPVGTVEGLILVGWSANLGTSWSTVLNELQNWNSDQISGAYFGVSTFGDLAAASGNPGTTVFGGGAGQINNSANNTPAGSPLQLDLLGTVPEPTTMALAALGGASLLLFRRKK